MRPPAPALPAATAPPPAATPTTAPGHGRQAAGRPPPRRARPVVGDEGAGPEAPRHHGVALEIECRAEGAARPTAPGSVSVAAKGRGACVSDAGRAAPRMRARPAGPRAQTTTASPASLTPTTGPDGVEPGASRRFGGRQSPKRPRSAANTAPSRVVQAARASPSSISTTSAARVRVASVRGTDQPPGSWREAVPKDETTRELSGRSHAAIPPRSPRR